MNKDDLIKDFMSDINHKELMQKYNLTKKEFDEFRTINKLEKNDRYILTDAAILEDYRKGFPTAYITNKHNLTPHKFRRFFQRSPDGLCWSDKYKRKRIIELYYISGKSIYEIHDEYELDYDFAYVKRILKHLVLSKRNIDIVISYVAGASVEELAETFKLNTQTIKKIVGEIK